MRFKNLPYVFSASRSKKQEEPPVYCAIFSNSYFAEASAYIVLTLTYNSLSLAIYVSQKAGLGDFVNLELYAIYF